MDAVERLLGRRFEGIHMANLLKLNHLDQPVQRFLQRVYLTLTAALLVSALGCYADMAWGVAGILTYLAGFGCLVGLAMTQSTPSTLNKRYGLLAGFSFCQGAALGRLVAAAASINPALPLTAFLGTAAVFGCFTLAALLSPRRSFIFLGGLLSSAVAGLAVLRLGAWLAGRGSGLGGLAFGGELYGGLMIFSCYVLLDTQMVVEKAALGYTDHVKAALDLLVDLLAIFARLLIILLRNQQRREEREERRSRDKRRD